MCSVPTCQGRKSYPAQDGGPAARSAPKAPGRPTARLCCAVSVLSAMAPIDAAYKHGVRRHLDEERLCGSCSERRSETLAPGPCRVAGGGRWSDSLPVTACCPCFASQALLASRPSSERPHPDCTLARRRTGEDRSPDPSNAVRAGGALCFGSVQKATVYRLEGARLCDSCMCRSCGQLSRFCTCFLAPCLMMRDTNFSAMLRFMGSASGCFCCCRRSFKRRGCICV